jgi:hypothetical protein
MRKLFISNFLFLISFTVTAHPGIGIVKDRQGKYLLHRPGKCLENIY